MSVKLPRAAIAAALASTLLLVGCNDDGGSKSDDSPASQSQGENDSGDAELTELEGDTFYETVMTAQKEAGSFKGVTVNTVGTTSTTLDLEGEYTDDGIAATATTRPDAAQQLSTIVVDGVMYLQADGIGVPEGKWLKFDPNDPKNADSPLAPMMDMSDPQRYFAAMNNPKEFELVGEEDVDGVPANHYRLTMDSATYAENLELPKEIADLLPPELSYDMWVDAENRPVKVVQEFEAAGQSNRVEQTYSDYGADVDIEAPADADTVTR